MSRSNALRFATFALASALCAQPALAGAPLPVCGNGAAESGEQCDDNNTVAGDGCSATCTIEGPLDRAEQGCVNGMNAGFAGIVAYTNKAIQACLKDVSAGKAASFEACLVAISFDKPGTKLINTNTSKCTNRGVTEQTAFGYNDDPIAVATEGAFVSNDAHRGVLGNPAPVQLAATSKAGAKCQQAISAGVSSYLNALAKETNKRKKASLKDKTSPALTSIELEADLVAAAAAPNVTKVLEAAKAKAGKKCEGQTLAPMFPGECDDATASASTLLDCAAELTSCEFCRGLNAADRLSVDCAQFSPWPACDPATPEDCGDGEEQFGEECDDGNTAAGDGCRADCTDEVCGDGTEDPQEECDDGNTVFDDGCGPTCLDEVCGDGIPQTGEPCDDGNTVDGDGCREDCSEEICGDGTLDPQEACDDSNTAAGDGCDADCNEEFDCAGEGGTPAGPACFFFATAATSCTDFCAAEGLGYDGTATTALGSAGTDLNCQTVLGLFGFAGGTVTGAPCATGLGCWADLVVPPVPIGQGNRCTSPTTDGGAVPGAGDRRVCACNEAQD
jgi:cysteine-rich repeat protein